VVTPTGQHGEQPAAVSSTAGEFTELPVLRHERIWGFWQFTSVNVGLAIATWAFLTGGTIALFAGVKTAIRVEIRRRLGVDVLVQRSVSGPVVPGTAGARWRRWSRRPPPRARRLPHARVQAGSDTGTSSVAGVQRLSVRGRSCALTTRLTLS
jgi:hypothetical protein